MCMRIMKQFEKVMLGQTTSVIECHESFEAIINSLNLFEQYMLVIFFLIKERNLIVGVYVSVHDSEKNFCVSWDV